jgi:hypothetical protein
VWGNSNTQILIAQGGGTVGVFVYNGFGAPGNFPVAYMAPPSVTADPFGNVLPVSGGGVVSLQAGADFSQLVNGGIAMGLLGAPSSAIVAAMEVANNGAGQSVEISSGAIGAAAGSLMLLNDSGVAISHLIPGLQVINGADNVTYTAGQNNMVAKAAQTITLVAPTIITPLSQAVAAGRTYHFEGVFRAKQGAVDNVQDNIGFSGPAISYCNWFQWNSVDGTGTMSRAEPNGTLTTLGAGTGVLHDTEFYIFFTGDVTFSASGTFSCVAGISTNTFFMQPGSEFNVRMIG